MAAPVADADYNDDGTVDAADYVVWRKSNINGAQGYADWVEQFGNASPGSGAGGAVPEPATGVMAVFAFVATLLSSRRTPVAP